MQPMNKRNGAISAGNANKSLNKRQFSTFSPKQKRVLTWWTGEDKDRYNVLICDGAVRSGKTTAVAVSFILWAMECYQDTSFAICGKTVGACRRNVVQPLRSAVAGLYRVRASGNVMELSRGKRKNRFYLFGGKDEGSAALIQGMTLGGVLLDEAALMPRSFVEQAMARCSVEGAKIWMSLNPEGPTHWLYTEWICKAEDKKVLRLHFTMEDNPSLSESVRERYRGMYSGVFYRRFILGEWAAADGLVYPMFSEQMVVNTLPDKLGRFVISIDYGTMNPFSAGLWGESDGKWYRMREFYHNGREKGALTDEEYYQAVENLAGDLPVRQVIVDPSAASFIQCIRKHGRFSVRKARNSVLTGIRHTAGMLSEGKLLFHSSCRDALREFTLYVWDKASGKDQPVKDNDHAMDDIRYFVETVATGGNFSFS